MFQHCLPTDPKDDETIIEAELIMQYNDGLLLEATGIALEELQRASMFIEIAQALTGTDIADPSTRAKWAALLIGQALLANECAVDIIHVWPDRLEA